MFSFNRVHIIGYQTQPVTIRQTPGGSSVTDLNLVVPYAFRTENGETLEGKGFHTVTLWGPMADVAGRYMKPGSQVFISGRLQTDSWENEQTGEKRSKTKIVGLDMILLDPKDGLRAAPEGAAGMLGGLNRADIIGNVTKDPEMRTTTGGQQVLTLGVATNDRWKDRASGEDKERSEFHNVVIWGALAERVAKTLHKGNRVFVCGRVQTRSWETKEGAKRYTTEVIADQVSLLGTHHPLAEASIQAGAAMDARGTGPAMSSAATDRVPAPAQDIEAPEVAYASEIKVEDLPF
ncbi:MAG: single-stranded DNA-binding protein [Candidatus Peribacteraceae bacterium]|nr:single-stranded DNA-binding protein [Candidatus Peribacteraceae bacterium]